MKFFIGVFLFLFAGTMIMGTFHRFPIPMLTPLHFAVIFVTTLILFAGQRSYKKSKARKRRKMKALIREALQETLLSGNKAFQLDKDDAVNAKWVEVVEKKKKKKKGGIGKYLFLLLVALILLILLLVKPGWLSNQLLNLPL